LILDDALTNVEAVKVDQLRTQEAKKIFKKVFASTIKDKNKILDEAAFPAYAHRNPIIDRIFWGRLAEAELFLRTRSLSDVLDFGCGSGVMSFIIADFAKRVVATDIQPVAFDRMRRAVDFPSNVQFATDFELADKRFEGSFDAIIALDVLEHIQDLQQVLQNFKRLLKPRGIAVISGPTENVLYRIGRRIAGERFTGDYHVSNIGKIEAECRRHGSVQMLATLSPILPLFKVFSLQFDRQ
jgi:2-polyprenyl-3-methyl-5-hydroxy-6-metoxy-1,4-benzoquinol methylase